MTKKETKGKEKVYYDKNNVGAFGGVQRFARQLKKKQSTSSVKNWLQNQPTYTLHKPLKRKFPTRKYRTSGLNELWQMDLMEMIPYSRINKGYKYILTCVDVFSRFARALPLKSKNAKDVSTSISNMIKHEKPHYIQTDLGKEFYNKDVQLLFKKNNIKHYTVHSHFKAALVERFNRTLREKMNRIFTYRGDKSWHQLLPSIIDTYNNSRHRGIFNQKPIDITKENEYELWEMQQPKQSTQPLKATYKLLNYVRISRIANEPFIKNFDQN